jgi:hypothetical protein
VIALAADGGLWLWPDRELYPQYLLKLPKQPQLLGNIFGKTVVKSLSAFAPLW